MLVLSRNIGETIKIGDYVSISVVGVSGMQVRIGIDAPKEIGVHRSEVYERIKSKVGDTNETR
jgi:carbon storage regulator